MFQSKLLGPFSFWVIWLCIGLVTDLELHMAGLTADYWLLKYYFFPRLFHVFFPSFSHKFPLHSQFLSSYSIPSFCPMQSLSQLHFMVLASFNSMFQVSTPAANKNCLQSFDFSSNSWFWLYLLFPPAICLTILIKPWMV